MTSIKPARRAVTPPKSLRAFMSSGSHEPVGCAGSWLETPNDTGFCAFPGIGTRRHATGLVEWTHAFRCINVRTFGDHVVRGGWHAVEDEALHRVGPDAWSRNLNHYF